METKCNARYQEFDCRFFTKRSDVRQQLVTLYCQSWETDEAYGEYRICPLCHMFYNYEQVEILGIEKCLKCQAALEVAWKPDEVEKDIARWSSRPYFYGNLVFVDGRVRGLSWLYPISSEEIRKRFGERTFDLLSQLNPSLDSVVYYDDLIVDRDFRHLGIGRNLINLACQWSKKFYPGSACLLRVHIKSRAYPLFQSVGYNILCEDIQHGGGRILMAVPSSSCLRPENITGVPVN